LSLCRTIHNLTLHGKPALVAGTFQNPFLFLKIETATKVCTGAGYGPDILRLREDDKIIFNDETILLQSSAHFYDFRFSGDAVVDKPIQGVEQDDASQKDKKPAMKRFSKRFLTIHDENRPQSNA